MGAVEEPEIDKIELPRSRSPVLTETPPKKRKRSVTFDESVEVLQQYLLVSAPRRIKSDTESDESETGSEEGDQGMSGEEDLENSEEDQDPVSSADDNKESASERDEEDSDMESAD